jgi:YHS domain-containing protein
VRTLIVILLLSCTHWASGQPDTELPHCSVDGVAVGGYDLLSYHSAQGPVAGLAEFSADHEGGRYQFVNAHNLARFSEDPQSWLPVYKGWCATTLAMGRLVCPDYTNYKIEEGQLLFFELAGFTNGRTLWDSDPAGFRQRADANFKKLLN